MEDYDAGAGRMAKIQRVGWKSLRRIVSNSNSNEDDDDEEEKDMAMEDTQQLSQLQDLGLPLHLLTRILSTLPVSKLLQLRLLCKSWNSLLQSSAFLEACSCSVETPSDEESWLVMTTQLLPRLVKDFFAYSPSLRRWFQLPLNTLSSSLGQDFDAPPPDYDIFGLSSLLISGAGGLICFVMIRSLRDRVKPNWVHDRMYYIKYMFEHDYNVFVLNILTGAVKQLPPPLGYHDTFRSISTMSISMVANSASNSYHVVLSDVDRRYHELEVYDSKTNSWKVGQAISTATFTGHVHNGDLFSYDIRNGILSAYIAEADHWSKVEAARPWADPQNQPVVMKCKERVLLVSCLHGWPMLQGFGVWELLLSSTRMGSWVKVDTTPPKFWGGFCEHIGRCHYEPIFIGDKSLICMTAGHNNWRKYPPLPLVYDLILDSWYELPSFKGNVDLLGLFSFQPRFGATV